MNKKTIEIKVDVMRQFELMRRTTFKDPLCLLDEDIQNADRSGAKNVHVTFRGEKLTIENDGEVLKDPEVLFTMGKSGWSDKVKESENPFGMGFFSNIPASNFIEIYSGHHHVVFDEREELTIYSEEVEEYYDGFKLILNNFKLEGVYSWNVAERIELLGKHIHNLNVFYNNTLIQKKSLTEGENLPFEVAIEGDELFIGWLALSNSYFSDNKIKVFYKGRYVTALDDFYYVKGEIHINDKALTLQSPDRKDIINDERFTNFKKHLTSYIANLAEKAILTGEDSEVVEYEKAIEHYVDSESIRYRIPFVVFDGKAQSDMDYLSGVALAIKKEEKIKTIGEYDVYLRKQEEEEKEKELSFSYQFEEKQEQPDMYDEEGEEDEDEEYEEEYHDSYTPSYTRRSTSAPRKKQETKKEEQKTVRKGNKMYLSQEDTNPVFWVKLEEIGKYEKRIDLIKEYGIRLFIAQNKIEENVLERSNQTHVHHIGNLEQTVTIKSYISNTKLTAKEQRASMLLDMISRMYGYERNVFSIGDVMVTKKIEVPRLGIEFEKIEETMTVVANKDENMIYIDRSIIENSMLSEHEKEEIEITDYKFILLHLRHFIEEISLLNTKGNKAELYEKTVMALAIA